MLSFKKNYSKSKINAWSDKGNIEKLISALEQGNKKTKLLAIDALVIHNFMSVKRTLSVALDDKDKDVSLRAVRAIEFMGANREELVKIKAIKKKWQ
jgi:hypothetical protein